MITQSVLNCVFGLSSKEMLHPGLCIKKNIGALNKRVPKLIRNICDTFDSIAIGSSEQEVIENCRRFRSFLKSMIDQRREQLSS